MVQMMAFPAVGVIHPQNVRKRSVYHDNYILNSHQKYFSEAIMVNIFWFLRGTNEVMAREVFGYDDVTY